MLEQKSPFFIHFHTFLAYEARNIRPRKCSCLQGILSISPTKFNMWTWIDINKAVEEKKKKQAALMYSITTERANIWALKPKQRHNILLPWVKLVGSNRKLNIEKLQKPKVPGFPCSSAVIWSLAFFILCNTCKCIKNYYSIKWGTYTMTNKLRIWDVIQLIIKLKLQVKHLAKINLVHKFYHYLR